MRDTDVVRAGYRAFNAQDFDAVTEVLHPEIVWDMSGGLPDGPVYLGHAGFREFVHDALALWDVFELRPREMRTEGGHVLVLGSVLMRSRGHGMTLTPRWGWLWTLENGLGTRLRNFGDWDAAREAMDEVTRPVDAGSGVLHAWSTSEPSCARAAAAA